MRASFQRLFLILVLGTWTVLLGTEAFAEDEPTFALDSKWTDLYQRSNRIRELAPLTADMRVQPLDDLAFTGPQPGHPFVLGKYEANGEWGMTAAGIQLMRGTNAALKLAEAEDFELDGTMTHAGFGGWFLLFGWDEGRGYALSNVTMAKSGSPWFLSEFKDGQAIENQTIEFPSLEWKGQQKFSFKVEDRKATFKIGNAKLFTDRTVDAYAPGAIILGTYDTKLGPKKLLLQSVRGRAIEDK